MKGYRFIRDLSKVMFVGWTAGLFFSGVMLITTRHPYRSSGCILISIGMILMFSNLQIWAEKQMFLKGETEKAKQRIRKIDPEKKIA